jgi:uncharacterized membrane protein YjgN (DUF898 family)
MTNPPEDGQQPQYPDDPSGEQPQQYPQPPYGQPQGYPPVAYAPDHPKATTALILGILGIVVCGVIAPFAWRTGKRTVDEIDASHGQLGGRASAQAGYILGIIGTALLALALLAGLLLIVVATIATVSTTAGSG